MTPAQKAAMQQALEILRCLNESFDPDDWCGDVSMLDKSQEGIDVLTEALSSTDFQMLTNGEIDGLADTHRHTLNGSTYFAWHDYARAVEQLVRQKLGIKTN